MYITLAQILLAPHIGYLSSALDATVMFRLGKRADNFASYFSAGPTVSTYTSLTWTFWWHICISNSTPVVYRVFNLPGNFYFPKRHGKSSVYCIKKFLKIFSHKYYIIHHDIYFYKLAKTSFQTEQCTIKDQIYVRTYVYTHFHDLTQEGNSSVVRDSIQIIILTTQHGCRQIVWR